MSDSFVADILSWFETLEEWIPGAGDMARDLIVGRMPEADQEAVYQLAETWGDAAVRLGNAYEDVARSAEEIIQNWTGDGAAMQFADQWFDFLEAMRSTADSLGSLQMGVNSYGLQVELQKFMVALNLILLGATLIMIIAAMLPSGGTSAGGIIPAFMAASRLIYLAAGATIRAIASISIRALLRGLAVFLVRIAPTLVRTVPTLVRTTVPVLVRTTAPTLVRTTLPNAVRTALPIVGRGAASVGRSFLPSNLARGLLPRNVIARALANRMAAQATRGLVTRAMLRAVAGQTGAAGARALGWRATLAVQNQLARTIERQLLERFGTRIGTAAVERSLSAGAARLSSSAINQAATRAALTGLAREIGEVSLGRELARYIGSRVAAGAAIMGGGNLAGQLWQISTGHRAAGDISWEQAGIATFQGAALGAGMWGSPLGHMLGGAVTGGVAAAGVSAYTHAVHDLDGLGADDWSSIWAEARAGAVHGAVAGAVFGTLAHVQSTAMHLPLKIGHDVQVVQGERGLGIIASDRTSGVEMWTARGKGSAYFRLEGGPIDQGGRLAERGLVDPEGNVVFHETFNPVRPQLETTIVDAPGPGRPALPPGDAPASQGPPGIARPDILRPEVVRPEVVRGGEGSPDRPTLPPGDPAKVPLDLPRGEAARLETALTRAAERPLSELTHRDIDQILRHPERHEPSLVRHVEQHFARQISDGTYRPLPDADVRLQAQRLDATVRQHLFEQHEELTLQRARWEAERSQNPAGMKLFERFDPPPPEPPRPVRQPDAFSGREAWRAWGEHQAWQSERAAWEAGVERTAREVFAERASPRLASEVDSLLSLRQSDGSRVPMTHADLVRVLDRLYEARAQGDAALREAYARLRDEAAIGGEYTRPEAPARPTEPGSPPVEPVQPVDGDRPGGERRLSTMDNKAAGRNLEPFDLEQLRAGYRDSGRPAVPGHDRDLYIGRPLRTETPADPVGLAAAIDQALARVPAPSGESVRGVSSPWRATEIQPVGDGLVAVRFRDGSAVEVRIEAGRLDSGAPMRIEYPDLRFDEAGRARPAEPVRIVIDERVGADRPASRPVETAIGLRQGLNEVHKWLTSPPDGSVGPGEVAGRRASEVLPAGETVKPSHTVELPEAAPARDGDGTVAAERVSGADEAAGARVRPVDHVRAMAWAAEAYERFRATDADIADIVGNLAAAVRPSGKIGFAPAEITQIKRHVLYEEHLLDDYEGGYVRKRFAPDEDMAEAWVRLRSGRHLYADLVLLEHELAESNYLRANPGATYRQAHNHANESYNWEAMIPRRTGEDLDVLWAGGRSDGNTGGLPEGAGGPTGGRVRLRGGEDGPAARDPQGVSGGHPPRREQGQELHQDPLADSGLLSERSALAGEGIVRSVDGPAASRFAERADTSFLDALLNQSTRGGELVPVDRPGAPQRPDPAEPSLLDEWLTVPPEPPRRTPEPVAGARVPFRIVPVPAIPLGSTVERPEAVRDAFDTHLDDLVRGHPAEAPDQPYRATWDPDANTLTVHYPDGPSVWVVPQVNSVLPAGRPVVVRPNLVGASGRWVQAGPAVVVLPAHTSPDPAEHRDLVERHLADAWRTLYAELRGTLPSGPSGRPGRPVLERPTPVVDDPARREDTHVEGPVAEPAHEQRAAALPAEPEIPVLGPDRVRFRDVSPAAPPAPQPLTPEWVAAALADRRFPARSVRWVQEHLAVRGDDGSYVPKSLAEIGATVASLRDEAVRAVTRPAPSTPPAPEPLQPAPLHILAFAADGTQSGLPVRLSTALGGHGDQVVLRAPKVAGRELAPGVRLLGADPIPGITGRISPLLRADGLPADADVLIGYGEAVGIADLRRDAYPDAAVVQVLDRVPDPNDAGHLQVLGRADLVVAIGPEVAQSARAMLEGADPDTTPPVYELPDRLDASAGHDLHWAIDEVTDRATRVDDETWGRELSPREVVLRLAGTDATPPDPRVRVMTTFVAWSSEAGGGATANRELAMSFAAAGAEVYARVPGEESGTVTDPRTGVQVSHAGYVWGVVDQHGQPDRRALMMRLDDLPPHVDIVVGHSRFSGGAAAWLAEHVYPDARYVHVLHSLPEQLDALRGTPQEGLAHAATERALMAAADLVVGVGPLLGQEAARLSGGPPPPVHTMISDMPAAPGDPPSRPPGRSGYEILIQGRVGDPLKGVEFAARVVAALRAEGIDVRLVVRGAAPGTAEAQAKVLTAIAGVDVTVRTRTTDGAELTRDLYQADLVLMPSVHEGFGLVASEAARAGVPVLVGEGTGAGMFFGDPAYVPAVLGGPATVRDRVTVQAVWDALAAADDPRQAVALLDERRLTRWVEQAAATLNSPDAGRQRALDLRAYLDARFPLGNAAQRLLDALAGRPDPGRAAPAQLALDTVGEHPEPPGEEGHTPAYGQ